MTLDRVLMAGDFIKVEKSVYEVKKFYLLLVLAPVAPEFMYRFRKLNIMIDSFGCKLFTESTGCIDINHGRDILVMYSTRW